MCMELPVCTAAYVIRVPYLSLIAACLSLSRLSCGANSRTLTIHLQFLVVECLHSAWKLRQFMKNKKLTLWGQTATVVDSEFDVLKTEGLLKMSPRTRQLRRVIVQPSADVQCYDVCVCVCVCMYVKVSAQV